MSDLGGTQIVGFSRTGSFVIEVTEDEFIVLFVLSFSGVSFILFLFRFYIQFNDDKACKIHTRNYK